MILRFFFLFVLSSFVACSGTRPNDLGIIDNQLKPCPDKPNCVSSFANKDDQKIDPLTPEIVSIATLKQLLANIPRTKIVAESNNYLHVEFKSALMGFVDDVEFLLAPPAIHVRSASRLGYSDLGVNRKRIEEIRHQLK